jgi:hypothetical protein
MRSRVDLLDPDRPSRPVISPDSNYQVHLLENPQFLTAALRKRPADAVDFKELNFSGLVERRGSS